MVYAMYKHSRPAGPVEVNQRRILAVTASGARDTVTPDLLGVSITVLDQRYHRPLMTGDTTVIPGIFERLNRGRADPYVELDLVSETYTRDRHRPRAAGESGRDLPRPGGDALAPRGAGWIAGTPGGFRPRPPCTSRSAGSSPWARSSSGSFPTWRSTSTSCGRTTSSSTRSSSLESSRPSSRGKPSSTRRPSPFSTGRPSGSASSRWWGCSPACRSSSSRRAPGSSWPISSRTATGIIRKRCSRSS